ncbi:hypothetical protein ERK17_02480 [Lactobacillus kullabergensis]|nr:hypothetical protein [Lactobacillus kullabergensis]
MEKNNSVPQFLNNKDEYDKLNEYDEMSRNFINFIVGDENKRIEETELKNYINRLNTPEALPSVYDALSVKVLTYKSKNNKTDPRVAADYFFSDNLSNFLKVKQFCPEFYYKLQLFCTILASVTISTKTSMKVIINETSDEMESQKKELKTYAETTVSDIKSSIYTDFIAILGIFTAITFAIFGGIQAIGSITSNLDISSNNPQSLGNLLICASILGILLYGIITVLFAGIDKLTKRTWSLPFTLNILVIGTLVAMFLIGCIYSFLTKNVWSINITPRFILSLIVIIFVVGAIWCAFYKHNKSKN